MDADHPEKGVLFARLFTAFERIDFEAAARQRGIGFEVAEASAPSDIEGAIDSLAEAGAAIIFIQSNAMFFNERSRIARLAIAKHMAAVASRAQLAEAGYLLAYGTDFAENYSRAAIFVDKILKGAKPRDLPVEFPTKLVFTINLKTAKALGIEVPEEVILLADKMIE